jgi:membrane-associated PAP2 superfamily phosphatase
MLVMALDGTYLHIPAACMFQVYHVLTQFVQVLILSLSIVSPDDGMICRNIYIESVNSIFLWYLKWILDFYYHNVSPRAYAEILRIDKILCIKNLFISHYEFIVRSTEMNLGLS